MKYKHIFTTRFGYAALLYSSPPFCITEIFLPSPSRDSIVEKTDNCPGSEELPEPKAILAADSIIDYFEGRIESFPSFMADCLDFGSMTPLERKVLQKTASVPYGRTASYREIAEAVGRPRAYRFVGNTLAKNPFPVIIPCHRIIKSDGSCGGFGGGRELKMRMLALEKRQTGSLF